MQCVSQVAQLDWATARLDSAQAVWGRQCRKAGQTVVLFALLIGLGQVGWRSPDVNTGVAFTVHCHSLNVTCVTNNTLRSAKGWTVYPEATGQWILSVWPKLVQSFMKLCYNVCFISLLTPQCLQSWHCLFPSTQCVCSGHREGCSSNPRRKSLNVPVLIWEGFKCVAPHCSGPWSAGSPGTVKTTPHFSFTHSDLSY